MNAARRFASNNLSSFQSAREREEEEEEEIEKTPI